MNTIHHRTIIHIVCTILCGLFFVASAAAQQVELVLKDGRVIQGRELPVSRIDEKPDAIDDAIAKTILLVDDGVRQTFIPKWMVKQASLAPVDAFERFRLDQRYTDSGKILDAIGVSFPLSPFDEYGRRIVQIPTAGDSLAVVQSITEINPRYVRAQGLQYVWDARFATNTFPRAVLAPILRKQLDPDSIEDSKRLVRFYIQAGQLDAAATELDDLTKRITASGADAADLAPLLRRVQAMASQQVLDEIESRFHAGQYELVRRILKDFAYEHATPETLQRARRLREQNDAIVQQADSVKEQLHKLAACVTDAARREEVDAILAEIDRDLSLHAVPRFAAFLLHANNDNISEEERLAIGLAAWFVGSETEVRQLATATSLRRVRDFVADYLVQSDVNVRREIVEKIRKEEAAAPSLVAAVLATMRPPFPIGEPHDPQFFGYHEVELPASVVTQCRYAVQLPPEYNPDRRYPLIVALNGSDQTPQKELDFWTGHWSNGERMGQCSRHGYIVLAPEWNPSRSSSYDFSARAHDIVLSSLRDLLGRVSVDTDRIFITGHDTGGDAAWDIGMAHPDLWGGVIPFGGIAGKYINAYSSHARILPFYYVGGELEGFRNMRKSVINSLCFNRYLKPMIEGHQATVVLYKGRGAEMFHDELPYLFDWMELHPRDFCPKKFSVYSLRAWDNFFWWLELGPIGADLPDNVIEPAAWTDPKYIPKKKVIVEVSSQPNTNRLKLDVSPLPPNAEVFLTPDIIDFQQRAEVSLNGKSLVPRGGFLEPSLEVILEDARTRRDRKHPFWVRLTR
ncbi:MAG: hypothetical protein ACRC46_10730 [Thermoguttaceae bacterium]